MQRRAEKRITSLKQRARLENISLLLEPVQNNEEQSRYAFDKESQDDVLDKECCNRYGLTDVFRTTIRQTIDRIMGKLDQAVTSSRVSYKKLEPFLIVMRCGVNSRHRSGYTRMYPIQKSLPKYIGRRLTRRQSHSSS